MIIPKEQICGKIRYAVNKIQFETETKAKVVDYIGEKYNVPTGIIMDYFSGRLLFDDATTFQLFVMADGLDEICETKIVEKSFSEIEIKEFSSTRLDEETIQFPIKIKCIQVGDDQWIGACGSSFLMKLRDAQLINYNVNTQRTMQRVVRGDKEFYRITINNNAVERIEESLNNNIFIPNTITLNIPEDEFDFKYVTETNTLVVNAIPAFDITDGYHRYLAISRIHDRDDSFDYPLELRITHFSEDKTKQFIFQEDQKTKMRRIDSDSMDMAAPHNILVERLNANKKFYWCGDIKRNDGRINFAEMAKVVQYFYYRAALRISDKNRYTFLLEKELVDKLNRVIADNAQLMDGRVDFAELMIVFYCVNTFDDIEEASQHIAKGLTKASDLANLPYFKQKKVRAGLMKYIKEIV